jgi:hypothetical protein
MESSVDQVARRALSNQFTVRGGRRKKNSLVGVRRLQEIGGFDEIPRKRLRFGGGHATNG